MKSKQFKLERKIVVLMVFLSAYSICIGADNQTYSSDHLTVINKKRVKKMINKKLMNEFGPFVANTQTDCIQTKREIAITERL